MHEEIPRDLKSALKKFSDPEKLQEWVHALRYNPHDSCRSALRVWKERQGHCLEGALFAAWIQEMRGGLPQVLDLRAHRDDDHVVTLIRHGKNWGAISKSNTTLLGWRAPVYRSVRELVMSYFPFYFNSKGQMSLQEYCGPINLRQFNAWNWRSGDEDLVEMGISFNDLPGKRIQTPKQLVNMHKAPKLVVKACFLGANVKGLYQL